MAPRHRKFQWPAGCYDRCHRHHRPQRAGLSRQRVKRKNERCGVPSGIEMRWVNLAVESEAKQSAPAQGIITTLVKHQRYGFIAPDAGGRDVFFRTFALTGATLDEVDEGDRVLFELEPGSEADERGPRARTVRPYQGRPVSTGPTADTFRPLPRHRSARAKKPGWRKS